MPRTQTLSRWTTPYSGRGLHWPAIKTLCMAISLMAWFDAFYAALEKINQPGLTVAVTESGWPTAGNEPITSPENAETYNRNLLNHVEEGRGTPRRPSQPLDVYFFAMFNEDLKQAGIEQHWGFFYPNMQPVYSFWQCP
ncbi:GLYCOSYL HYDROLASE SUPERFAMILY PROTEIN [Salix koriyanagi]|uniref:glucan endo-1,3-beta-D-glucosidase n=1 Tax=Salix koriyanagi TaxID=2511006 RepID=A0A9Q0YS04_9ROSI|nr:GLYCOSYL HYDROLASE SUPERFAMILY PROTEIN [Salix koriyanagi]